MKSFTVWASIAIVILALVFSLDLFLFSGRSVTFDAHVHMTTFMQFARALQDGEFPVRWADGFANYGLPLPLFAHQTTSYLGAVLSLLTGSPVLAYNLLVFSGAAVSGALMYTFLRFHVKPKAALLGTGLFMVAPYRMVNVYVRGALPEFFATVFVVWLLIGIDQAIARRQWSGLVHIFLATALLALTHPMFLLLALPVAGVYGAFTAWPLTKHWRSVVAAGVSAVFGVGAAGYYLLPLLYDIRYTNYGSGGPEFSADAFLSLNRLFTENWGYFGLTHPGPRAETLVPGIPEMLIFLFAIGAAIYWWKKRKNATPLYPWIALGLLSLFFVLPVSGILYSTLPFLGNVQFPWRMLSAFLFVPPVLFAILSEKFRATGLALVCVLLVFLWRIPQMYGKNYLNYDLSAYSFTQANLHSNNMNTLWMADPAAYPPQQQKLQLISGEGSWQTRFEKNASREYFISAQTPLRLVEYTFYFPGWEVEVDGQPVSIEFQDPEYRGILTFSVPEGDHVVSVSFTETRIRLLGFGVTAAGLLAAGSFLFLARRYPHLLWKKRLVAK